MTFVKLNNRSAGKSIDSMMDELFSGFTAPQWNYTTAPANISETADAILVELVAPGFEKTDFNINLEDNLLTISAGKKKTGEKENMKRIRTEFTIGSFKKTFTLDEQIEASNICATYENGVLTLNLPKKPEVKASPKEIKVQ